MLEKEEYIKACNYFAPQAKAKVKSILRCIENNEDLFDCQSYFFEFPKHKETTPLFRNKQNVVFFTMLKEELENQLYIYMIGIERKAGKK